MIKNKITLSLLLLCASSLFAKEKPRYPLYVEIEETFISNVVYYVNHSKDLWECDDNDSFMDRVIDLEKLTYNYCLGERWQVQPAPEAKEFIEGRQLVTTVKRHLHELFTFKLHKARVASFWYIGIDAEQIYPDEMYEPVQEKLICCSKGE